MSTHELILVVEDEEAIRTNIVRLLRIEGFDVQQAANGSEGLALARERHPALILSDVMMPVMDGHQMLAALRHDPLTGEIPVVFLTARADHGDIRAGMNLGADDYLLKPFQRDDLLAAVRTRLARRREQAGNTLALQQQVRQLAQFDPLTELPNQSALLDRARVTLAAAHAGNSRVGVMMVGLDGLKHVNHSLGIDAGDRVLRAVAKRLHHLVHDAVFVGEHDMAARLTGDRFALLIEGFADDDYLAGLAQSAADELARPLPAGEQDIFLTASIGVAVRRDADDTAENLLQRAEVALDAAKASGPRGLSFFSEEMQARAVRRMRLHNELHKALERGELSLHYQPQVAIAEKRIVGFEALMRWNHPELGFVSPAEFIPVAEESGIIVAMGTWALHEACRQVRLWLDAGFGPVRMAVNLSARQFAEDELLATVVGAMARYRIPPEMLELEITESIAMQGVERTVMTLTALKKLGLALAMDDFGTGYSSLAYLKRFPLDVLKVDQSFVRNVTSDPGDAAITRAVVAMAHSFGLSVIAEGVETADHLDYLAGLGCEDAQGYHFSKPLPAEAAGALLARGLPH